MKQPSQYSEEVNKILANLDEPDNDGQEQSTPDETPPITEVDVYIESDRITFIPKKPPQERIIDSTPVTPVPQKPSYPHIYALSLVYVILLLSILTLQLWLLLNPPIATITIYPRSEQITLTGTLQLGRIIAPITLTQSQTVPTTGKGHQNAKQAAGYITFYNGQFQSVTVPAGIMLTGSDGVQIIADQTAYIPAASPNPPIFGQVTVSAHATNPGSRGNISAYDINQTCCATSILVKNTAAFHGGQDERNFQTVTTHDLNEAATALKTTLAQSMQAALQSQVQSGEALVTPPCTPIVTSDHKVGEEAVTVKVTGSEACSAVAYNSQELKGKVTDLLTHQAIQTLGTGYSLLGDVQVTVKQATAASAHRPVFLSFVSQGTWAYALTSQEQQHIKELIAGKSKRNALQLLQSVPGIKSASIAWTEQTTLPNDMSAIHLVILVEA